MIEMAEWKAMELPTTKEQTPEHTLLWVSRKD